MQLLFPRCGAGVVLVVRIMMIKLANKTSQGQQNNTLPAAYQSSFSIFYCDTINLICKILYLMYSMSFGFVCVFFFEWLHT